MVEAAKATGADAIHPGYGFLSENEDFARRLAEENIIFIGPHPDAIEWMGSKSKAKEIAEQNNVPVVPGYKGNDQSLQRFEAEAAKIGFPVLLKAAAGGGGKGMRIVNKPEELSEAFSGAKREALSAFGNDELLMEKYFPSSRHIEIQIFGDKHGHAIYLLERECTIQRRYQKIFEESPSPVLTPELRKAMGEAAVRLAKALRYDNAGTVEFLYSEGNFYFLEVNTRLQVEHPVTEAITGLDLVKLQIECAEGKPLAIQQKDVIAHGYALECRLYAEDPENNFLPTTGTIALWHTPDIEGLRFDSGIETGSNISIFYDPMISKIIAHGSSRPDTLRKMSYALRQTVCLGTTTNHAFLLHVLEREDFAQGDYDTHFIARKIGEWKNNFSQDHIHKALCAATVFHWHQNEQNRTQLRHVPSLWRNIFFAPAFVRFKIGAEEYTVSFSVSQLHIELKIGEYVFHASEPMWIDNTFSFLLNGIKEKFNIANTPDKIFIQHYDFSQIEVEKVPRFPISGKEQVKGGYMSPMPATVVKVLVRPGEAVSDGQSLVILTSMKMENTIVANENGTVEEIFVSEGENIEAGKLLLKLNTL
jgi:acetyl/propionyl-CoA carboxylase alpha subunit